ncbi:hypothetical protein BRC60_09825 [Halobacteriales archaeon QH_1_68_42]|nr:MAG: hypothetical protein BRC60_09825 [Halobacteriales archaeon QH_1_68_42]
MQEAWIQLQCPGCEEQREANPADLPGPQATRTCKSDLRREWTLEPGGPTGRYRARRGVARVRLRQTQVMRPPR